MRLHLIDPHAREVERIWRELAAQEPPPVFLGWGWIENWLACLPRGVAPPLAVVDDGGAPIAAAFLGRTTRRLAIRVLHLNTTGITRYDELCLEHNAILRARGARLTLADWVELLPGRWDELAMGALDRDRFPGDGLDDPILGARVRIDRTVAAPYVDLAAVRAARGGYLDLVHNGTRAQLRRARRELGALEVEVAGDVGRALAIYDDLVRLHGARWHERGEPGAFADPWFDVFHRRLIATRFVHGELQLIRVCARGATIGCLYNLIDGAGRVAFYQSGFARFADPHVKPGYVCHAEAIAHAAAAGHAVYDLLGGDARYKHSLATGERELVWARVQRPRARFAVEDALRAALTR